MKAVVGRPAAGLEARSQGVEVGPGHGGRLGAERRRRSTRASDEPGAVILLCPRCGSPLATEFRGEWFATREQCSDCGVALRDAPGMLRPSDDEVRYGLDGWPANDRAAVTAALADLDAPYRWEPGLVLVVPAAAESDVDRLLDDIDAGGGDERGSPEDDDGFDGGEEAQAAMGELFVAADRLQHDPVDRGLAVELAQAATVVQGSLPPYGVEPQVWARVQDMAEALASSSCDEPVDVDAVSADAHALRELLREYV